jgi:hypothetical protein
MGFEYGASFSSHVAADDFVYAEPQPAANGFAIVTGASGTFNAQSTVSPTVGVPFTGVVATFSDADPNGNARDYTATINWGDGHFSNGTIAAISADSTGLNGFAGALNGGAPASSVALAIVTSAEADSDVVTAFYLKFLHRQPDSGGQNSFVQALAGGTRDEAIIVGIESSDEYFGRV